MLLSVAILCGGGCESAIDCFDNDGPEFKTASISDPVLNQVYSETITVAINNEPRDDNFLYEFRLQGRLPAGVTGSDTGRRYLLDGTPTELGTFRFTVYVSVDDSIEPSRSGLCFYNASRTYEITVQPL
jgi:hypothetical protein